MTHQRKTPATGQTVAGAASNFHKAKQSLFLFPQTLNASVFAPLYSVADALALIVALIVAGVLK